jgi:hypothetical protein
LGRSPLPAIAATKDGGFFILAKVAENKALIHDPIESRPVTMARAELEAVWNRNLIFIAKPASPCAPGGVCRAVKLARFARPPTLGHRWRVARKARRDWYSPFPTLKPNASRSSSLAANVAVQSASYGRARFKTYPLRSLFQIKMSKLKRWTDEADEFFLCP